MKSETGGDFMKKIITVSRQFGSGGRSIAKAVAAKLGYDYYDEALVNEVAEKTGFAPNFIKTKLLWQRKLF